MAVHWTLSSVTEATDGTWVVPPVNEAWSATGFCYYAPYFSAGNLVFLKEEKGGVTLRRIEALGSSPSAVVVGQDDAGRYQGSLPVLSVTDPGAAMMSLGRYARAQMTGKVIGVTGSAGKTTLVTMLGNALSHYGSTGQSAHSVNLPRGVAWNLSSIPWDTGYIILEMAIGRMKVSSLLARPDIAVFTNIFPAHQNNDTLQDIARTKSCIFAGMPEDGIAIVNHGMAEKDIVLSAARSRHIRVIQYGDAEECECQLLSWNVHSRCASVRLGDQQLSLTLSAPGMHMMWNVLAVLSVLYALGEDPAKALQSLERFMPLSGRGEESILRLQGRTVTIIDDAYNANPGSMMAALQNLSERENGRRRVAVLGQMEELGPSAEDMHSALADYINQSNIDKVWVTGENWRTFWALLEENRKGKFADSVSELESGVLAELHENDVLLFKGSNSTGIHQLVNSIKAAGESSLRD